jgi:hypothetical protein
VENERLLLVAPSANSGGGAGFNVAGRISEALAAQITAARLADTRVAVWPESVDTPAAATQVVELTRAVMMIWDEYDSGRVRVHFVLPSGSEEVDWQRLLSGPDDDAASRPGFLAGPPCAVLGPCDGHDPEGALPHCDHAAAHDAGGSVLDARGLILAELGRYDEAAADLARYVAWLDTQPEIWQQRNNRQLYVEMIATLEAGENPITAELLARLR